MAEWWVNNVGQNLLKGVEGDATNPILLADEAIASFFDRIPEARASYIRIRTSLLPAEVTRLNALLAMALAIETDLTKLTDAHQSKWNKAGIRTAGRYGGTRRGGNT